MTSGSNHKKFEIKIEGDLYTKETLVKDLFVYKRSFKSQFNNSETQGLCFKKELRTLVQQESPIIKYNEWNLVNNELLESLLKYGWAGKNNDYNHFDRHTSKTPYDDLNKKDYSLVKLDGGSYMVFDHKLQPLPVAIHFNYIMAKIRSGHYDLEKLIKILNKNRNVVFTVKNEKIPYYESGVERCCEFIWSPTIKEYRKMWSQCLKYKKKYPSAYRFNAISELDLLGIEKARLKAND